MLIVSIIREGYEDIQRYRNDRKVNRREFKRINPNTGKKESVTSSEIKVGDMLYIREEQEFPSDLILIDASSKGDGEYSQSSFASMNDSPDKKARKSNKKIDSTIASTNEPSIFGRDRPT